MLSAAQDQKRQRLFADWLDEREKKAAVKVACFYGKWNRETGVGELTRRADAPRWRPPIARQCWQWAARRVAWAHNAGRVELLVTNLQFTYDQAPGQGVMVSADLIDRDSGASAAGFAVVVTAAGANGAPAGPVTLTDPRDGVTTKASCPSGRGRGP